MKDFDRILFSELTMGLKLCSVFLSRQLKLLE